MGRWKLDTESLELAFEVSPGRVCYFVDLERMGSSAAMLDWIIQVHKKNWCTIEDTGHLVAALQDIFDPQSHLCSFGLVGKGGGTFDATAHLRALYGESEATKP